MTKKKILFVDDEPNLLAGLKRTLRSMRGEFDMEFVENAAKALEVMASSEFDVVVSDMRMPGMDGSELLGRIMKEHPYSIRIMLTGQADEQSILRTVGIVHQFLAKPCEPEALKSVLIRASGLHDIISRASLRKIVSGIDHLPSLPELYAELQKAMANPEVSIADIGKIIEKDLSMSAKVLQLVNSAFFGLFKRVDSPAHAVNLLGIDTVKNLVLGVGAFSEIKARSKIFPVQQLWNHSMSVSACAKKIAVHESCSQEMINNCFVAGMLHDIGKLVLLSELREQYEEAVTMATTKKIPLRDAEKEIFGALHGDIGAYLMGLWGIHGDIVEAIGFHHRLGSYPDNGFNAALAVHVANALFYEANPAQIIGQCHGLDMDNLYKAGLDEKIPAWREVCNEILLPGDG